VLLPHDAVLRGRVLPHGALGGVPDGAPRALPPAAGRAARRAGRALPRHGDVDAAPGRPLRLGHAARGAGHHGPAREGPRAQRRLRPGAGRVPRRPRRDLDAPELLRSGRGRHPRGRPADRRGRARAGGAARDAHGPRAVRRGGARAPRRPALRRTSWRCLPGPRPTAGGARLPPPA
jgi:hypothetical protein